MSEPKTRPHDGSVPAFLDAVEGDDRREDCRRIAQIMQEITGEAPRMWGPSMVGFGSYRYRYASGREGDWFVTGFAPRKRSLTLYIMAGFRRYEELMKQLGTFKIGKSCLYVNRLSDVDETVLRELITESVSYMKTVDVR